MKKMISLLAMTILSNYSFCQETLQTVTDRGNVTTNPVVVYRNDASYRFNASNGVDADVLIGATAPGASIRYGWIQPSVSSLNLIFNPNNGGNVGIGTISPAYKLDVNGTSRFSEGVMLGLGQNLTWGSRFEDGAPTIAAATTAGLVFYPTGITKGEVMRITPDGNIGIGTNAPQSELAVKGTITSMKVKVTQTGWADYVFDSSYQLLPLPQVEKFIQENRHLSEVPSAAEVKKDGLDLGDNQVVLLKKIEELTLYIIQQNKELAEVKKRLADVEAKQSN